jgi:hypothetical protein
MYEDRKEPVFDAPVPGMGMTHELGARPWQQPAQYTKMDDIAQVYVSQMQDDAFVEQALNLLETKMPVTMIANAMQTTNVMNGVHSIDTGVLVLPIIMEMIMLIADTEGIDYVTGTERNVDDELNETRLQVAVERTEDGMMDAEPDMMQTEEVEVEEEQMPTGLMARRT